MKRNEIVLLAKNPAGMNTGLELNSDEQRFGHQIFRESRELLVRRIVTDGRIFETTLRSHLPQLSPEDEWWLQIIRGESPLVRRCDTDKRQITVADLFCGSGGFTNGLKMAAAAFGVSVDVKFAIDTDSSALDVYRLNHNPRVMLSRSVKDVIDSQVVIRNGTASFYYDPALVSPALEDFIGEIDLVVAGPPCQGHSNLNNHTRRDDVRNALYPTAAEIAVAVGARGVLIENVPAVLHDRYESVRVTTELLQGQGWSTASKTVAATDIGWPQTRKRHFLSASSNSRLIEWEQVLSALKHEPRPLSWLLNDLVDRETASFMDQVGQMSEENVRRIDYLFDNECYTLPDHIRPKSHQGGHTYPSSYGRMRWDQPSGTITTGFMTPGRGRFVHPLRRRPITPHEAARIQGFPDVFIFGDENSPPSRAGLAKWIGDAVPGPLGYVAAMTLLPSLI